MQPIFLCMQISEGDSMCTAALYSPSPSGAICRCLSHVHILVHHLHGAPWSMCAGTCDS